MKRLRFLPVVAGLMLLGLLTAPSVAAYGNSGGAVQTYQIAVSFNCNNPTFCGPELGGFWGWVVLYADGTGEAELTGCGHMRNGGGPGTAGAGHFHSDFTWIAATLGGLNQVILTSETDVFLGHGTPVTASSGPEFVPTGIPTAPGHYSTADVFGFSAPGVAIQIQVTKL